jgi:outer membrane biosynthesis protein TonB
VPCACSGALLQVSKNAVSVAAPQGRESFPARTARVDVSEQVSQAFLSRKVEPEYPEEARSKHVEGSVVLRAEISKAGDLEELTVVKGNELLIPPAVAAVR